MDAAERLYLRRKIKNGLAMVLAGAAAIFGLFWLLWILWTTVTKGVSHLNLDLFTMMTPPPEERGGMLNAFFGSAVISTLAMLIGTPIGIAAGTYLAEYANHTRLGTLIRFVNDVLLSVSSAIDMTASAIQKS